MYDPMNYEPFYRARVETSGDLQNVPVNDRTAAVCRIAVERDGMALFFVPNELKTETLCLMACQNNGSALEAVPEQCRTPAVSMAAVMNRYYVIYLVPVVTEDMCWFAICKHYDTYGMLFGIDSRGHAIQNPVLFHKSRAKFLLCGRWFDCDWLLDTVWVVVSQYI